MKIVYYSKYSNQGPSSRYRAFQFVDSFRNAGIEFEIQNLFDDEYLDILRMPDSLNKTIRKAKHVASRFRNRKQLLGAANADLFVIEGQLFPYLPFVFERAYLPERFLLEFDDAIYLTHPSKFPKMIRKARAVLAGNRTLAAYANQYNQEIHVVPTVVDTGLFQPKTKHPSEKIRIGWIGLEYNFKYLRSLTPVFWKLSKQFPIEIVILSSSSPCNLSFPFRFEKWQSDREVDQINEFDIGVMPLEIDKWCEGKCGFKLIQYMSLGIPAVATPVGVNSEIIQSGENGFTAVGLEQWEETLTRLLNDASLRERIGKSARQTIVERYSTEVWFPRLLEIYSHYSQ